MTGDELSPKVNPETAAPKAGSTAPGGRFGLGTVILVGILSAVTTSTAAFFLLPSMSEGGVPKHEATPKERYQCPMHPAIVQDHMGDCPICGMKLVKVEPERASAAETAVSATGNSEAVRKIAFYRSPMDRNQTSPTPRKDEMGMDYLPIYEDEVNGTGNNVEGMSTVDIDPERQQLIGLRTVEVVRGQVGGLVRTVGRVAVDETRVRHINVKNGGFVERIFVDFVGKRVRRGAPLFSMYSPELLATQEEYLLALRTHDSLKNLSGTSGDNGRALIDAAARRLDLWDVSPTDIKRLAESGRPTKTVTVFSPVSGVVTRKDVVEGMKLDAGAMPYEIVDLSKVWVLADVYESELRFVKTGTAAVLTLKAFPNTFFEGKVVFVDPFLDAKTRTVKVRLTFPNPKGDLRPEMFGEVVLKLESHEGLVVPEDAIIDSGTTKVVFVAGSEGKFQPRSIETGQSDGTLVEVIRGLEAGERVVTRANFLVDSESRLRASLSATAGSSGAPPESARVLPASGAESNTQPPADGHANDAANHLSRRP